MKSCTLGFGVFYKNVTILKPDSFKLDSILKLGELGEISFGMLELGELGEMSFQMLELGKLDEVSFRMLEMGELGKVSFVIMMMIWKS